MNIKLLLFGITTDLVGTSNLEIAVAEASTISNFKSLLKKTYPH